MKNIFRAFLFFVKNILYLLLKPDKILLDNPNLLYALCPDIPEIGIVRETFFCNQLASAGYVTEYGGMKNADFRIDGKYVIEVGGIDTTIFRKIPLWAFGFLH